MNAEYRAKYLEIKRLFKKFVSKGYFEIFNSENLFFMADSKMMCIAFFAEKVFHNSYGIQFYFNQDGLNYLHDAYTTTTSYAINPVFSETTVVCFASRDDLLPEDIDFLHRQKLNVMSSNNLMMYRFKAGYRNRYLTSKELDGILDCFYYLSSLISNEEEDLEKAFEQDKMALAVFNNKEMLYEIRYTDLFNLERFPKNHPCNDEFVTENQQWKFTDDTCYLVHSYIPTNRVRQKFYPSILMMYSEQKNDYVYQIISCLPTKICDYVCAFLEDYFRKYGRPNKIVIDSRKIYAYLYETFKKLSIDVVFKRESELLEESIIEMYEKIYAGERDKGLDETVLMNYVS